MSDSLLGDVTKGAAMGLPFGGPVGAAIGGLGGIVAHFAPSLLSDLLGQPEAKAVQMATAAAQVVQQVTGTIDPAGVTAAAADANVELQLRVQLAKISADARKAELDATAAAAAQKSQADISRIQAQLNDVADARRSMVTLAGSNSKMQWGPAIISGIVLGGFFGVILLVLLRALDQNSLLVGGLLAMATNVVSFWTGSNSSSIQNRQQLVDMANKTADSVPNEIASKMLSSIPPQEAALALPFLKGVIQ